MSWQEQLKEAVKYNGGTFGHNVEFTNIKSYIKNLIKVGCHTDSDIKITDYYTMKISLNGFDKGTLLHLLTFGPMPSDCKFDKTKCELTVEWHY